MTWDTLGLIATALIVGYVFGRRAQAASEPAPPPVPPDLATLERVRPILATEGKIAATLHRRTARVLDPERLARDDVTLWGVTKQDNGDQWDLDDVAIGESADVARNTTWVVATAGDSAVAGPVRALDGAAETTLTLHRGGWLIVMPTRVTDEEAGRARVRRADGAPLGFGDGGNDNRSGFEFEVYAGQRLGPFEPGDLEFVLEPPAPARSSTLRVRVEASAFRPLHIPAAPAR